jgi:hypothetical protein
VVASAGFAFMASNTVGQSFAGEGANQVSGYTVSDIVYSGVATQGGQSVGTMQWSGNNNASGLQGDGVVTTVSFTVNPDNALWSEVQLYDANNNVIGGGGASNCAESAGVWTCSITGDTGYNSGAAWSNQSGAPVSFIAKVDVEAVH